MADITIRQVRYFAVLSKVLQYQRAARQLGISQPSLSLQISALENAIGGRLVERKRNGLILTPVGRAVALQAEKVLREVDVLKDIAVPDQTDLGGTLRLGSSPTIGPYLLPRILRQLHLTYPDLKMVIRDGPPRELSEDLAAGQHDMVLTQLPLPEDDFRVVNLYREELHLAVPRDHPLAGRERVRPSDLAGEGVLTLRSAYAMHRQVAAMCQSVGANLREDFEGTSLDALRQMVSLGMGVTLLPALYAQSEVRREDADVIIVRMQPVQYRLVGLAWRTTSGNPASFLKLVEFVRQVIAEEFSEVVTLVN